MGGGRRGFSLSKFIHLFVDGFEEFLHVLRGGFEGDGADGGDGGWAVFVGVWDCGFVDWEDGAGDFGGGGTLGWVDGVLGGGRCGI